MSTFNVMEGNGTETVAVTNGETIHFEQGTGMQVELTSASGGGQLTFTNTSPNVVQTTVTGSSGSCTGNSVTATRLATARTIAGVSFNGTANISLNNNAITNGAGYTTNTGDITGVTAGTGLTGGGTSGTVTLNVGTLNQNTTGSSGSCTGNAATATNATTAGGLAVGTGVNNSANQIVRTNGSGYTDFGWINTVSGAASGAPARIYCSQDAYIRYYTPAQFAPYILNQGSTKNSHVHSGNSITSGTVAAARVATLNQNTTGSSGSCTGNAATATWADTVDVNNNNNANSSYYMVWHSGDSVYSTNGIYCNPSSNSLYMTTLVAAGNVTAYSDKRVKTNLEVIPNALEKVSKLNGYTFDRTDLDKDEDGNDISVPKQTGVIAQEVLDVLPEVVSKNDDGMYSVAYGNMVGLLIEAIKELKAEVEELKGNK